MAHLQYFTGGSYGERRKVDTHMSQVVQVDNILKISGQGGWDRETEEFPAALADEVARAFANVQHVLESAGGTGWSQVYLARFYLNKSFNSEMAIAIVENLRKRCPNHEPVITVVEVSMLHENMKIEIEVEAHLGGTKGLAER